MKDEYDSPNNRNADIKEEQSRKKKTARILSTIEISNKSKMLITEHGSISLLFAITT